MSIQNISTFKDRIITSSLVSDRCLTIKIRSCCKDEDFKKGLNESAVTHSADNIILVFHFAEAIL